MKYLVLLIARVVASLVFTVSAVAQGVPATAQAPAGAVPVKPTGSAQTTGSVQPTSSVQTAGAVHPTESTPNARHPTIRPPASSVVKDDDWTCTFLAKSYDWLRFELNVSVLSTYRLMNCTPFGLDELTTASAAAQLVTASDFLELVKGGSHQSLMDVNLTPALSQYYSVSNLKVAPAGVIRIGLLDVLRRVKTTSAIDLITKSYMRLRYESHTSFIWNPGTLGHRLVDPDGVTYIMSGYTRGVHPDLKKEDLINLKTQLQMPPGWRFESYFLNRTVKIEANDVNGNTLHMVFDDLNNRYFEYRE